MNKPRLYYRNGVKLERISDKVEGGKLYIGGYGAHYATNKNGEKVVGAEAYEDFFKEMNTSALMPRLNYMHTPLIVGAWEKIENREDGLYCEGYVYEGIKFVRENIIPIMEIGALNRLSTEEFITDWEWEGDIIVAKKLELVGVSLVDVPADFNQMEDVTMNSLLRRHNAPNDTEGREIKEKETKNVLIY